MKSFLKKRFTKQDREEAVLLGLVELYIKHPHPIGSNSLKESGFEFISSATIRNYFSKFEKMGYLKQSHISGGRVPTSLAYRHYANVCQNTLTVTEKEKQTLQKALKLEGQEVLTYLHESAEKLSNLTNGCVFLTSPRFDQDYIHDVKFVSLDDKKVLCILITHFGVIRTETFFVPKKLTDEDLLKIQDFFLYNIGKIAKPVTDKKLLPLAQHFYNEIMLKHIIGYAHYFSDDIYKTGLSKLLSYPELSDPAVLAKNLALFENPEHIESFLHEAIKINRLTSWIGEEIKGFSSEITIFAIPYYINQRPVGAVAIMLPTRNDYPKIFAILQQFSQVLSEELTRTLFKYKIAFRQPLKAGLHLEENTSILLEDKSH